ncbi:MAG: PDZ domain-containing protein [Acidimicrobiales bacterium]
MVNADWSEMDTSTESLPATPEPDLRALRRSMWRWVGGMVGVMVVATAIGGTFFRVPYVAIVPGSATDTEGMVTVSGADSYPSEGEILLTTVRTHQRPNLWEYLWLSNRDDARIVPEELILGERSVDENREYNSQLMQDSKQVAIAVALEELGYDAVTPDGIIIVGLVEGSAADGVVEVGDELIAIDAAPLASTADLIEQLKAYAPGDQIDLTIGRLVPDALGADHAESGTPDGGPARETIEVTVDLGANPDDLAAAFLGVQPTDRVDLHDDFGFTIDIDSGVVGGPSAGLAYTLAVLDDLTPGELTGGRVVAVTGTMDVSGRVGPIGGVAQKTVAVREHGADAFIVPAGLREADLAEVYEQAGDDLQIIPVNTIDEALDALAGFGGDVEIIDEFAAVNTP